MATSETTAIIPSGIEPIDDALGGLEAGRAHVLYGDAETGKTTIAHRFLLEGLRRGEPSAIVVRYRPELVVETFARLGYDCAEDLRTGRLVVLEYASDLVDRLGRVEDLRIILDELGWILEPIQPTRLVLDTADFIFAIQYGYGYSLQVQTMLEWFARLRAATLLIVEERTNERIVQSFRANASTVLHAAVRPYENEIEYHLAFEKAPVKAPHRRIDFAGGEFTTLEIYDAQASTLPLPAFPRRRRAQGDRTGQLTMPAEAARIVAEAAASPDPVADTPPRSVRPAVAEPVAATVRSGRPRVLVIDEDRVAAQLIARALEPDFDVSVETDSIAGLARVAVLDPDLIVLEANLSLVDGFTICRQVRDASAVPIIMTAGTHVTHEDRVHSGASGADHYLTKPFNLKELSIRARQLVARYRGQQLPVGAAAGSGPHDPLVSYDQFLEVLLVNSAATPRALIGSRLATNGSVETTRILDIVRAELHGDDFVSVEPDEHQIVALVSPDNADEFGALLTRRIRESTGADVEFWSAPVGKGTAMRVLGERVGTRPQPSGGHGSAQRDYLEFLR